ncbi:MAG TPA: hypothetical protein VIR31_05255 [Nitrososphaeraceae archaeon]|jgi:hypothetical protein
MVKDIEINLKLTEDQHREIRMYIDSLTTEMILFGLRFAYKRHVAISGGYLMPGRKSLVKRETHLLSYSQAKWRLNNWKSMIGSYREKGYSYPTISRIKKEVQKIVADK